MGIHHSRRKITKTNKSYLTSAGPIDYTLSRSNARRTLSIQINEKARVQVSIPQRTTLKEVHAFLDEKANWIQECILSARAQQSLLAAKKYADGAEFLFLGKKFPLVVFREPVKRARIDFNGQRWEVKVPEDAADEEKFIKDKIRQWYKKQAEEILGAKAFQFARDIGVTPQNIQIRNQKRLWGCCDWNKQSITLNWQIILAPIAIVDYVVIHELCHLIHPNHGKRFWNKVGKFMPDYSEARKWLRDHQTDLMLPK